MNGLDPLINYGFAGVALLMLYNITENHLKGIQTTLTDIKMLLGQLIEQNQT